MTQRARISLGLLSVAFISALLLAGSFLRPVVPLDEGIALVYPELILKGYIPNLDFCSLYPPGNFWLLAAVFKVFGANVVVERLVGFGYVLGISFAVFFLALSRGVNVAVILAAMVSVVLQMFSSAMAAYSWFGAAALALWSLVLASWWLAAKAGSQAGQNSNWLLLVSGLAGGLAILFRHDFAPVVVLSGLATIGLRRRPVIAYGLGVLVGLSPLLAHALIATPAAVIENMVWDVLRAGPTRRLPLPLSSVLFWEVVLSCVAPAVLAAVQFVGFQRREQDRILLGIAVLCIGVLPQALSRADVWHLSYVGCFTIPLSFVALLHLGVSWRRAGLGVQSGSLASVILYRVPRWQVARVAAACCAVLVAAILVQSSLRPSWWKLSEFRANGEWVCNSCVVNEGRVLPVSRGDLPQLQEVIDDLEARSAPGDRLFVGPRDLSRTNYNDSFLFFLFPKLEPGTFYIEMASGVSNRPGTRLSADLSRAKFALLDSAYDEWHEDNSSSIPGSAEPLAVLDREFCLILDRAPYQLYARCDRPTSTRSLSDS